MLGVGCLLMFDVRCLLLALTSCVPTSYKDLIVVVILGFVFLMSAIP